MKTINSILLLLTVIASCKKNDLPGKNPPPDQNKWMVTTFAGTGSKSFNNGPVGSSTFHFPFDITMDNNGVLYIADFGNFSIRKILSGNVSTLAGTTEGFLNGPPTIAQFKGPFSITADTIGNIYSTDDSDPRIRKITPAGNVSTYAGTEIEGFADGKSNVAQFGLSNSITCDQQGNIYIADEFNNRIRKIDLAGNVSTVAGNGTAGYRDGNGSIAEFNYPTGIAIDHNGNLFISDGSNFRIRKISPSGEVTTVAGNGRDGTIDGNSLNAGFSNNLNDLVADNNGNLYVEDGYLIRKIFSNGTVTTIAGSGPGFKDGDGLTAKFNVPVGIAIDANGNLYIADVNNNRIRKISLR
jgi:sugar lactone lactonase YvrE